MRFASVLKGLISYLPGTQGVLNRRGTGGSTTATYCYEMWMKHVVYLGVNGLSTTPNVVAEAGPGDSLGLGITWLLSGAERYLALDVVRYSNTPRNLEIFDELVELFRNRTGKTQDAWPEYGEHMDARKFPSKYAARLDEALNPKRIARLRQDVEALSGAVQYVVPWSQDHVIEAGTVDLIVSQSVLEHVIHVDETYRAFNKWLKPGGAMSHQIDFASHGLTREWNGQWSVAEPIWRIAMGRRPYLINRVPCSTHIELIRRAGFKVICDMRRKRDGGIGREQLAAKWANLSDEDLTCSGCFVQAVKAA